MNLRLTINSYVLILRCLLRSQYFSDTAVFKAKSPV